MIKIWSELPAGRLKEQLADGGNLFGRFRLIEGKNNTINNRGHRSRHNFRIRFHLCTPV